MGKDQALLVLVDVLSSTLFSLGLGRPPGTSGAAWGTCKYLLPALGTCPGFSPSPRSGGGQAWSLAFSLHLFGEIWALDSPTLRNTVCWGQCCHLSPH